MPNHLKQKRIYYVNILKKWKAFVTERYVAEEITDEEDFPDWKTSEKEGQPKVGEHHPEKEWRNLLP